MADGRIGHSELDIAGARMMLSDEHPEIGVTAPEPGSGATCTLHLSVDHVDEVIDRCTAAGATLERPAADYEYGRNGVIRDPFGHRWMISSEPAQPGLRHGDIGYVSLWVPDVSRAASFFASVLGWRYEDDGRTEGRRVVGHHLHHGMWGGVPEPTLFCCFAVDAVESAVDRIRAAGGIRSEPHDEPYGRLAEATDPLGTQFAVFTPPGGTAAGPPPGAGTAEGELVYVTMEVTDSDRSPGFLLQRPGLAAVARPCGRRLERRRGVAHGGHRRGPAGGPVPAYVQGGRRSCCRRPGARRRWRPASPRSSPTASPPRSLTTRALGSTSGSSEPTVSAGPRSRASGHLLGGLVAGFPSATRWRFRLLRRRAPNGGTPQPGCRQRDVARVDRADQSHTTDIVKAWHRGASAKVDVGGRTVEISSPDKVYFPELGATKLDLVSYYLERRRALLRTAGGRPALLQRFPGEPGASPSSRSGCRPARRHGSETTVVQTLNGTTSHRARRRPTLPTSCGQ